MRFSLRMCLLVPAIGFASPDLSPRDLAAQTRACGRAPVLSDSAVVSVLTVLPGDRLYSLFGHTIIREREPESGLDCGFNYGTFDFPQTLLGGAGFIARFAYGELDYALGVSESPLVASDWYWRQERRPTIEQTLDLTPDQVRSVSERLWENARPENRVYRYDFFFDNCSTRPRDVLEEALGPGLESKLEDPNLSFRRLLDPNLVGHPGVNLSMDIGLGLPADREASARDALFLPEYLMTWLGAAELGDAAGTGRPLVIRTDTLTWGPGAGDRTPTLPWPTILAWIAGLGLVLLTIRDRTAGRKPERRWLDGSLFAVAGIAGIVLWFLAFVSLHEVTNGNFNLMWAIPTHIVPAAVLLAGRTPAWVRPYMMTTLVLAVLFLVGIPVWPQEIPAAVVPLVAGIASRAAALSVLFRSTSESQAADRTSR